jgi:hypothetical protein
MKPLSTPLKKVLKFLKITEVLFVGMNSKSFPLPSV